MVVQVGQKHNIEYAEVKVTVSHWSYLDIFFDMTNNFMIENEKIPRQNDVLFFSTLLSYFINSISSS